MYYKHLGNVGDGCGSWAGVIIEDRTTSRHIVYIPADVDIPYEINGKIIVNLADEHWKKINPNIEIGNFSFNRFNGKTTGELPIEQQIYFVKEALNTDLDIKETCDQVNINLLEIIHEIL